MCRGDGFGVDRIEGCGGRVGDGSADRWGVVEREGGRLDLGDGDSRYCLINLFTCIFFPSSARLPLISGITPLFLYSSMASILRPVQHQQYELVGQDSSYTFVDAHLLHHGSFLSFFVNGMVVFPDLGSSVVFLLLCCIIFSTVLSLLNFFYRDSFNSSSVA